MIYALFPIFAAALYGLGYVLIQRAFDSMNVVTFMVTGSAVSMLAASFVGLIKKETLDFAFLQTDPKNIALIIIAMCAPAIGYVFTLFAIRETSASYAAFAEISYPLFTLLFMFLIFGVRQFDWTILLGGALVLIGSTILVLGQLSKS